MKRQWLGCLLVGLSAGVVACGRPGYESAASLLSSTLQGSAAWRKSSLPHPAPQQRATDYDAATENRRCEECHRVIAAEWRASLHRASYSDPVFLSAYAAEPRAFCKDCHAPEMRNGSDDAEHEALGVGCVTCHVTDKQVVGRRAWVATKDGHAVVSDARIGQAAWCGGCHQFEFPQPQSVPMQSTHSEHALSPNSDKPCQRCHMPKVGADGHRSHRFSVHDNAEMLSSAIAVQAQRASHQSLYLRIRATNCGHAVPTGDLFRRLVVRARAGEQRAKPVVLAREFMQQPTPQGLRRLQVADNRLPASGQAREVELRFAFPVSATVHWQVVYQRMGPQHAELFGVDLSKDETVIASGTMPALSARGEP